MTSGWELRQKMATTHSGSHAQLEHRRVGQTERKQEKQIENVEKTSATDVQRMIKGGR